jgi:tetratricopeptide (TPR) repeat protein
MSKSSRWERLEALFDQALELPAAERVGWVRMQSWNDPVLGDEVLAMLAAHESENGVLDRAPPSLPDTGAELTGLAEAIADKYVLEEPLGQGGMGSVFLAYERKHDRRVVIKVLRPEVSLLFGADRFKTEVELAARLSHPHILGLIDSGDAEGFLYYVMPYVGGETLRTRINRLGRLDVGEATVLLRDLADALAHAHAAGVIHRDIKPENVLCVGGHAFLMDFGIARIASAMSRRTGVGIVLGTPGYMSPEQQAGETIDHRTDIYSFGLVAREALLGKRDDSVTFASRPDIPPALASLVTTCLDIDSARRPADAGVVVKALDELAAPLVTTPMGVVRRAPRRWPWIALAVAAVAALIIVYLTTRQVRIDPASLGMPVVAAPLRNETGDSTLGMIGRLASDWITQGLQQTGRMTVVSWPAAMDAADRAEATGAALLETLRAETQAQTAVTGSYFLVDNTLRLQAQVVDATTGAVLGAVSPVEVQRDSIQRGVRLLRDRVMGMLAVRADARLRDVPGMLERPPTYEAYRAFDRGIRLYNAQDYREAGAVLRESWNLDTTFLVPLVYAATAAWNRGQYTTTDSLVKMLRARQNSLSEYFDLNVTYLEHLLAGEGDKAYQVVRHAATLAPGSRAPYNAARLALLTNRPSDALTLLTTMDPDRGLMRGWQSYWTQLSHALHLTGDHERELGAMREMRRRYPDSRVAIVLEARALAALGRHAEVDSLLAATEALPPDAYWSQAAALVTVAEEFEAHRTGVPAPYQARAIRWLANQLAHNPQHRSHRYWMGSVHYDGGRWHDAEPYLSSLAKEFPDQMDFVGLNAVNTARLRDSTAAFAALGQAAPYDQGPWTAYRARILAITGDVSRAVDLLSAALLQSVDGWPWWHASALRDLSLLSSDSRYQRLMRGE